MVGATVGSRQDPGYITLDIRRIPFDFPDDIDPNWIPDNPELSAMMNGASLTMPYLEPFLIKTILATETEISDPEIVKDIKGFAGQEAHHYKTHRKFNNLLISKGYPELKKIEQDMRLSYERLSEKSLQTKMAYTAGFEAMTMGVTRWIIGDRTRLFPHADSRVVSFVIWHMVEETEHKRVAHDVYAAVYGSGMIAYFRRAAGVFHGAFDVMLWSRRGYIAILKKNGLWKNWRSRLRLAANLFDFTIKVFPFLFRAALPGHDPRQEEDLEWVVDWLEGYGQLTEEAVPLVDTADPQMPVPF